jgi:hypothetical protein
LPANHKVSVGWQIVFTFITGLNFWAFYRIRKLRKYLLYIVAPELAVTAAFFVFLSSTSADEVMYGTIFEGSNIRPDVNAPGDVQTEAYREYVAFINAYFSVTGIGLALQGFSIYLVVIWSRKHNQAFAAAPS